MVRQNGVPLGMSRIPQEYPRSDPRDHPLAILLRQEPDEGNDEEDDDEDDGKADNDDDDDDQTDEGYSE